MSEILAPPWKVTLLKRKKVLLISQDRSDPEVAIAICEMTGGHKAMQATADFIVETINKTKEGA